MVSITLGSTGFLGFVHRLGNAKKIRFHPQEKGQETPTPLGPLGKANLSHFSELTSF
jgi:hypothetical protein